ncbi:type III-B CRISPR module-associated protein Cmr5 [Kingella negevensis]|uniref:type III-B CRISPR module-associated protein Cmr5 n=1 Tax=Kingella negevensis TaxID=1522312 RepID=UPI00254EB618|nr:type III-B CRISPR module-associated protein Cmr5 [Kingella negevensis]MDK4681148.1 type III-B CRISPR module-associated protein Cmr5 [Kingella negevensis]MDK4683351.1 type III-B CRISPR module-associated protein Cmr5 [Kingella negevensis]MDK4691519.1 type III-B CRISPR module-associated protein Cmr5 [Kingella negevensis]MDK4693330.1 type III-B CRISPR module-associated protein Cmr5 [Kingella negevensis]MDK4699630.1 type III-B CRISPR module-associated protein Cmr5 [Kingella negevensis]
MADIRSQKYAQDAYPLVDAMINDDLKKGYRTQALNLPNMILQSGLCQTVGFLLAKGKAKQEDEKSSKEKENEYSKVLSHLAQLLKYSSKEDFHQKMLSMNITEYQLLTRKALDASGWLKRYTQAMLSDDEGKSS